MLHLAFKRVKNREVAEDIVQISTMKAINALPNFRGESGLKTWTIKIMHNTATNWNRAQKEFLNVDDIQLEAPTIPIDPYLSEKQLLRDAIEKLPPRQRIAFSLHVLEGKTFVEIAAVMKCPYNTAKANYRHGLLAIKCRLKYPS